MKKLYFIFTIMIILLSCAKDTVNNPPEEINQNKLKFASSADVVINELCSSNSGNVLDEDNDDPDWIELYNTTDSIVSLYGYGLSDDSTDIYKWRFGNVTINPHSYILVFASGKNTTILKDKPSDDTINFRSINSWADELSGGKSTITTNEFPEDIYKLDGNKRIDISATLHLVDNRPKLGWSSLNITTVFSRQNRSLGYDYSMYNTVEFVMTLDKGKLLSFRFVQSNDDQSWKSPLFTVRGTGIKNDVYSIPLSQGLNGLDMKIISGIQIEIPQNNFGTVSFTLRNVRFLHTGYNLHTNFKLSTGDRKLFLSRADSTVLDTVPVKSIPVNMSCGKVNGKWQILKTPTPGTENVQDYYTAVSQIPQSVVKGGFYSHSVAVNLTCRDGETIHYTLDGTTPNKNSAIYSGPITIDSSCILNFVAMKDGQLSSSVQTESFFINESTKLPVISIITDPGSLFDPDTGIYMLGPNAEDTEPNFGANFWLDKEIPGRIQFFETDKSERFQIDAGISIMGNYSRAVPKKSLGLNFKETYGAKELDYPLFPQKPEVHKFKKIVLRNNGGNFGRAMIEDPMMQSLMDDRGVDYQKYRPVVVYINGKYFGLHQMMEAANVDYLYGNYNLPKEDVDFYDPLGFIKQGTDENWLNFNTYLNGIYTGSPIVDKTSKVDSQYTAVKKYMDPYNFIDYMAFEIFINNTDWPSNNCRWWRQHANGKWRWLIYDTDFGFGCIGTPHSRGLVSHNTLAFALVDSLAADDWPNGSGSTFYLRVMLENPYFREDFVNRFATLMATNFETQRVINRIDEMASEIKDEIPRDFKRWNLGDNTNSDAVTNWQTNVDKLKTFAKQRPGYMYQFIKQQFGITNTYTLSLNIRNGAVSINDMIINTSDFKGVYFSGIPVRIRAIPSKGMIFKGWSDGNTDNPRYIDSNSDTSFTAVFE